MVETIEILRERLKKEEEKKAKAENNIKKLTEKIEQKEATIIKATMKEYNVSFTELSELLKNHSKVDNYEET
jgi:prefoldin subunit 5